VDSKRVTREEKSFLAKMERTINAEADIRTAFAAALLILYGFLPVPIIRECPLISAFVLALKAMRTDRGLLHNLAAFILVISGVVMLITAILWIEIVF